MSSGTNLRNHLREPQLQVASLKCFEKSGRNATTSHAEAALSNYYSLRTFGQRLEK